MPNFRHTFSVTIPVLTNTNFKNVNNFSAQHTNLTVDAVIAGWTQTAVPGNIVNTCSGVLTWSTKTLIDSYIKITTLKGYYIKGQRYLILSSLKENCPLVTNVYCLTFWFISDLFNISFYSILYLLHVLFSSLIVSGE